MWLFPENVTVGLQLMIISPIDLSVWYFLKSSVHNLYLYFQHKSQCVDFSLSLEVSQVRIFKYLYVCLYVLCTTIHSVDFTHKLYSYTVHIVIIETNAIFSKKVNLRS